MFRKIRIVDINTVSDKKKGKKFPRLFFMLGRVGRLHVDVNDVLLFLIRRGVNIKIIEELKQRAENSQKSIDKRLDNEKSLEELLNDDKKNEK